MLNLVRTGEMILIFNFYYMKSKDTFETNLHLKYGVTVKDRIILISKYFLLFMIFIFRYHTLELPR